MRVLVSSRHSTSSAHHCLSTHQAATAPSTAARRAVRLATSRSGGGWLRSSGACVAAALWKCWYCAHCRGLSAPIRIAGCKRERTPRGSQPHKEMMPISERNCKLSIQSNCTLLLMHKPLARAGTRRRALRPSQKGSAPGDLTATRQLILSPCTPWSFEGARRCMLRKCSRVGVHLARRSQSVSAMRSCPRESWLFPQRPTVGPAEKRNSQHEHFMDKEASTRLRQIVRERRSCKGKGGEGCCDGGARRGKRFLSTGPPRASADLDVTQR